MKTYTIDSDRFCRLSNDGIGLDEYSVAAVGFLNIYGHGIEVPDGWTREDAYEEMRQRFYAAFITELADEEDIEEIEDFRRHWIPYAWKAESVTYARMECDGYDRYDETADYGGGRVETDTFYVSNGAMIDRMTFEGYMHEPEHLKGR